MILGKNVKLISLLSYLSELKLLHMIFNIKQDFWIITTFRKCLHSFEEKEEKIPVRFTPFNYQRDLIYLSHGAT